MQRSTLKRPSLFIYIRQTITLDKGLMQVPPKDVICLRDAKCVVLVGKWLVVVNFANKKEDHLLIPLTFNVKFFYPYKNGFLVTDDEDSQIVIFDENSEEKRSINNYEQGLHFKYHCQSSIVIKQIRGYMTNSHSLLGLEWDIPRFEGRISENLHSIDDEYQIADTISPREITTYNLKTKERNHIRFPFSDPVIRFFKMSQKTGICLRKVQGKISLWRTTFGNNGVCQEMKNVPELDFCTQFGTINKELRLLMLYNQQHVWIYDYMEQRVVQTFRPGYPSVQKRISPDFKHFVTIQNNKKPSIIHYYLVEIKKLLMFLFKKSKLERLYGGDALMRELIKLMI